MPAVAQKLPAEEKPAPPTFPSRRFYGPDFDQYGLWLLARLKEKFDELPERKALGWLRGLSQSNEYLFITNEKAVMLCDQEHSQLNPAPVIREIFCFAHDGGLQHAASLYADMKRWAVSIGSTYLICMRASDVPQPMIEEMLGTKLYPRRTFYARTD